MTSRSDIWMAPSASAKAVSRSTSHRVRGGSEHAAPQVDQGKTRLAVQTAAMMEGQFGHGLWYVDLSAITDPDVVSLAAARALGLPDQPGRSTMGTL
jgi:hypothetical protein